MVARRKKVLDIREIIRRCRLGDSERQIAGDLSTGRNTVMWYREWAKKEGLLDSAELPDAAYIQRRFQATMPPATPGPSSSLEPLREFIIAKRAAGVELVALLRLLKDEKNHTSSYSSLRRFAARLDTEDRQPEAFTRVETLPGEEAQVDFGYAGLVFDKIQQRLRRAWVFVMTLSFSRHQFARLVFDQTVGTWCALHAQAFEFFGGVVGRVKVDNLKAAITTAVINDPEANRTYLELAEHYGFAISPCRPRTPRHKGKVESGVHYVVRNALAGRTFPGIDEGNDYLEWWTMNVAGVRKHGTVHEAPLKRFKEREQQALKPLPATRYEPSIWKETKLHPDCHVVFDYNYYSAPHRLVGQTLWLRATPDRVEIYHNHERIATHPRAAGQGLRVTINDHYPPEKIQGLLTTVCYVKEQAAQIGPQTAQFVETLLAQKPMDRLRSAQGVVSFARRVGAQRLEAACARALAFHNIRFSAIKNILAKGLDRERIEDPAASPAPLPQTSQFARSIWDQIPRKSF